MESLTKFEEFSVNYRKNKMIKKTMFGIIAVLAGLLLLGFNFDLIDQAWKHIFFSWQMLLIAIGLVNVFDKDSFLTGIITLTVGTIFMIPEVAEVPFKLRQIFWPVILIFAGILVLLKHRFPWSKHKRHYFKNRFFSEEFSSDSVSDAGYITQTNIFGGSKKIYNSSVFKGGKITNIFGGGELDLRNTQLGEGRVILEITSIFGGMSIIVPSNWIVNIEVDAVLGGFQDKRIIIPEHRNNSMESELIIKGLAVFGGGDLKSV